MLAGLILGALLQAAQTPEAPPSPPPTQNAAAATDQQAAEATEEEQRRQRRCSTRQATGTRLSAVVRCRRGNGTQSEDTREALFDMQRPAGTSGN